jgi:hypothetical protein
MPMWKILVVKDDGELIAGVYYDEAIVNALKQFAETVGLTLHVYGPHQVPHADV